MCVSVCVEVCECVRMWEWVCARGSVSGGVSAPVWCGGMKGEDWKGCRIYAERSDVLVREMPR